MSRLAPCTRCGQHVFVGSATCPHCGAAFGTTGSPLTLGSTALLLGLTLCATACPPVQTKYGDTGPIDCGTLYADEVGDGYGDPNTGTDGCQAPTDYIEDSSDCDDTNPDINPEATETPGDGIDSNCNDDDDT